MLLDSHSSFNRLVVLEGNLQLTVLTKTHFIRKKVTKRKIIPTSASHSTEWKDEYLNGGGLP